MKSRILTRDRPLCLFLLGPCGFLEHGQGGFLLLKGGLCVPDGHLLLPEGCVLHRKSRGERGDGCFLALELSFLALELGLLAWLCHGGVHELVGVVNGMYSVVTIQTNLLCE